MTLSPSKPHPPARGYGGWRAVLGCTPESLALFRISLGVLLFCELVLRFRFLQAFYSDQGTLPLRFLWPQVDNLYKAVCVHCLSGSLLYQQVLLALQVVLAMCFTVNYRGHVQLWAALSWFLYLSLTLRNTWLNFILDRYFQHLLWYSIFLPTTNQSCTKTTTTKQQQQRHDHVVANENNNNKDDNNDGMIVSLATILLKLQVLWIYVDAGSGKLMDPLGGWTWHPANGIPALDSYARHTMGARYLYGLLGPSGLRFLTPLVVYVELLAAPCALVAAYLGKRKAVYLAIGAVCGLHIGIAVALRNTVLLSLVACSVYCTFLPPPNFEGRKGQRQQRGARVHTDQAAAATMNSNNSNASNGKQQLPKHCWTSKHKMTTVATRLLLLSHVAGSLWLELFSESCDQSVRHIWSALLHNRWNVFVGSEEYVTWEIAPGRLANGSIVDVWGRTNTVDWRLPGTGAPCTSTARPGRWRSFPYLAGIDGEEGDVLWGYLCKEWNANHNVHDGNPELELMEFNFFMLQADVLPNMGFSATRKRLIRSFKCRVDERDDDGSDDNQESSNGGDDEL